ncbi:hypothetical protein Gogos_002181 [Gossypium gossypioides]|uniref:Uncharacterized protein n=1 Tax=Gossypium gossypioides TaxID=34282 RepID=A0A7J9CRE8_GOSGO|nr:hypothetical protein [Gossypium gossypioides]
MALRSIKTLEANTVEVEEKPTDAQDSVEVQPSVEILASPELESRKSNKGSLSRANLHPFHVRSPVGGLSCHSRKASKYRCDDNSGRNLEILMQQHCLEKDKTYRALGLADPNSNISIKKDYISSKTSATIFVGLHFQGLSGPSKMGPGCASPKFVRVIRDYFVEFDVDVAASLETRVSGMKVDGIIAKIGSDCSHKIEARGFAGGLWICQKIEFRFRLS